MNKLSIIICLFLCVLIQSCSGPQPQKGYMVENTPNFRMESENGGKVTITLPKGSHFFSIQNVSGGNTCFYFGDKCLLTIKKDMGDKSFQYEIIQFEEQAVNIIIVEQK